MAKTTKIRQSARGETCTLRLGNCSSDETVVLAHLNSNYRGMGIKSPDIFSCYACYNCHLELDANRVSYQDQLRANQETIMKLIEKGLVLFA